MGEGSRNATPKLPEGCGEYSPFMLWKRGHLGQAMRNKENMELSSKPSDTRAVGEQATIS